MENREVYFTYREVPSIVFKAFFPESVKCSYKLLLSSTGQTQSTAQTHLLH